MADCHIQNSCKYPIKITIDRAGKREDLFIDSREKMKVSLSEGDKVVTSYPISATIRTQHHDPKKLLFKNTIKKIVVESVQEILIPAALTLLKIKSTTD
jgi:hypothetical protein